MPKLTFGGKSIVLRAAVYSAALCALVCVVVFFLLFEMQRKVYEDRLIADVEDNTTKVTRFLLGYFYSQSNWIHLEDHQTYLHSAPNTLYTYIVNDKGLIDLGINGLQSSELGQRKQPWEPDASFDLKSNTRLSFMANDELSKRFPERVREGDRVMLIGTPILCPVVGENCAQLRIAVLYETIQGTLQKLGVILIGAAFLLTLATALFVFWITRRSLQPIKLVSEKMRELARKENIANPHLDPTVDTDAEETRFFRESLDQFTSAFQKSSALENELVLSRSLADLAAQVAHDIRSPLAALDMVISSLAQMPEDKRVIVRSALSRIRDIANSLLEKSKALEKDRFETQGQNESKPNEEMSIQLLSSLVDTLVSEKRMQFRSRIDVEIEAQLGPGSYGMFARIQSNEFKRALSNLVNNAVESIVYHGWVTVTVNPRDKMIVVTVADNGKGIPNEIRPKLTERGATFGKAGGQGLGLYHAKSLVESWGGSLNIRSKNGQGTIVDVLLPKATAPDWFVPELLVPKNSTVVVLDDDTSIHQIWTRRFKSLDAEGQQTNVLHFSTPDEVTKWHEGHRAEATGEALYLCDFEFLGHTQNGLQLIESLKIADRAILVTSRYEEKDVRAHAGKLRVRIIPKAMAGFVPISFRDPLEHLDCVLIDDDPLMHHVWKAVASEKGKTIRLFASANEFFAAAGTLSRAAAVYVDSNLGEGVKGEDVAREIHALGFKSIYLATGYSADSFPPMPWITGIVGKSPPWA